MPWRRAVLAMAAWCLATAAAAHDFIVVRAAVVVDGATVTVTLLVAQGDLLMALGEKRLVFANRDELRSFEPRIAQYLIAGTHVRVDGSDLPLHDLGPVLPRDGELPPQLMLALRGEAASAPTTTTLRLDLFAEHRAPLIATVEMRAGGAVENRTVGRGDAVSIGEPKAGTEPRASTPDRTVSDWLRLGFEHIVPEGLDHILFVVGLFLLSPRLKPLLTQITAFTIAHSLTLGLSAVGRITLPSRVVEPLIAASIAFVAIENITTRELKPWRWMIVFCFGLVHGLGFAGALASYLPPEHVLVPLVLLNCGVELGQLSVVACAAALTCWFWRRAWYRRAIVIPASVVIAACGLFWAVQRVVTPTAVGVVSAAAN